MFKLIALLLCLILSLILSRKIPLGIALLLSATLFATLLLRNPITPILKFDFFSLDVILSTYIISLIAYYISNVKITTDLTESLINIIRSSKFLIMIIPMIFAFLPIPGGALLSAPFIGQILGMNCVKCVAINVWFRHIVFLVYPYTSIILITAYIVHKSPLHIAFLLLPLFIVAWFLGYVLYVKDIDKVCLIKLREVHNLDRLSYDVKIFVKYISPIFIPIILNVFNLPISIAVALASIALIYLYHAIKLSNVGLELAQIVEDSYVSDSLLLTELTIITFTLSMLFGSPLNSLVVVASLAQSLGIRDLRFYLAIESASLLGYIVSPIHLCLVLSCQYFNIELMKEISRLLPVVLLTLLVTLMYIQLVPIM